MAKIDRRYWPSYVGELWDAAAEGRSENASAVGHGVQDSRVDDLSGAEGEHGL